MQELVKDAANDVADLLTRFSFDLDGLILDQWVGIWFAAYPANWVRFSVIEALYQGRYKAFSVDQILGFWRRRGQPLYHFNHEFERIIRGRFSRNLLTHPPKFAKAGINQRSQPSLEPSPVLEASPAPAEAPPEQLSTDLENETALETAQQTAGLEDVSSSERLDSAILPLGDRFKPLSSEESAAFSKLRSFETFSPPVLKDLPIQAFRPLAELDSTRVQPKWTKAAIGKFISKSAGKPVEPIDQFVPHANAPPEFYSKLKAVASTAILMDKPSSH